MPDQTYFKFLDPELRQSTNIYMMQSSIITNDNIFDIFKTDEKVTQLFQEGERVDYIQRNI